MIRVVGLTVLLGVAVPPALAACGGADNPPDEELREALDIGGDREVPTVRMESREGAEVVDPATVEVRPGWLVEFRSTDGRVRTVSFTGESLSGDARSFLSSTGQEGSPPLVERDARFVVDFTDAPPGRYPFLVEGSGAPARGVVVVRAGR